MMNRFNIISFLVLSLFCEYSFATTYYWPVVDSISVSNYSAYNVAIEVSLSKIVIPDTPALDKPVPACKNGVCILSAASRIYYEGKYTAYQGTALSGEPIKIGTTWRKALAQIADIIPSETSVIEANKYYEDTDAAPCIAIALTAGDLSWIPWDTYVANSSRPDSVSEICFGFPPANQWCALTTPSITFDFGNVLLADAVDTKKKQRVNVECTTGMKFKLKISKSGDSKIKLDNGMFADLTVNGQALNSSIINGSSGKTNPIDIEATLTGTPPVDGGIFSGSAVMSVGYP